MSGKALIWLQVLLGSLAGLGFCTAESFTPVLLPKWAPITLGLPLGALAMLSFFALLRTLDDEWGPGL